MRNADFRQTASGPEQVARIWLLARGYVPEGLRRLWGKGNVNRRAGFCLLQRQVVAYQASAFKRDGVSDPKPAPAH